MIFWNLEFLYGKKLISIFHFYDEYHKLIEMLEYYHYHYHYISFYLLNERKITYLKTRF